MTSDVGRGDSGWCGGTLDGRCETLKSTAKGVVEFGHAELKFAFIGLVIRLVRLAPELGLTTFLASPASRLASGGPRAITFALDIARIAPTISG